MKEFCVAETTERGNTRGEFLALVHPDEVRQFPYSRYIVVTHRVIEKTSRVARDLRVAAVLRRDCSVAKEVVQLDQKLREALGASKGDKVSLEFGKDLPVVNPFGLIRRLFGVQVNVCRVYRTDAASMEINLARLTASTFETIGADEGDVVFLESTRARIRIRAMKIDPEKFKRLKSESSDLYRDYSKEFTSGSNHQVDPSSEIPAVQIDLDGRRLLDVGPGDPVRVYRSVRDVVKRRIYLISIPVLLAFVGAVISDDTISRWWLVAGVSLIALVNLVQVRIHV